MSMSRHLVKKDSKRTCNTIVIVNNEFKKKPLQSHSLNFSIHALIFILTFLNSTYIDSKFYLTIKS